MKRYFFSILLLCVLFVSSVCAEDAVELVPEQLPESTPAVSAVPNEEMIEQILVLLVNDDYRNTRQLIKNGEVVGSGYRGDAGAGVQQLLVDFGRTLSVDGVVGDKTIGALHEVQEGFGLPTTDNVDLTEFDRLLPLLFIKKDETTASSMLHDFYEEAGGEGYFDYLKACVLYVDGRYYSAKEAFENNTYGDSAQRAAACMPEWPANGEIWHNPDIGGSDTSLTFTVNSIDENKGMCFQMFTTDDRSVAAAFVTGSGSATVYIPAGTYRIRDCTGYEWYGVKDTFGPYGYYEYLTFSEDEATKYDAYLDYGGQYELSINVAEVAEGATSVGSTGVGWDSAGAFGE